MLILNASSAKTARRHGPPLALWSILACTVSMALVAEGVTPVSRSTSPVAKELSAGALAALKRASLDKRFNYDILFSPTRDQSVVVATTSDLAVRGHDRDKQAMLEEFLLRGVEGIRPEEFWVGPGIYVSKLVSLVFSHPFSARGLTLHGVSGKSWRDELAFDVKAWWNQRNKSPRVGHRSRVPDPIVDEKTGSRSYQLEESFKAGSADQIAASYTVWPFFAAATLFWPQAIPVEAVHDAYKTIPKEIIDAFYFSARASAYHSFLGAVVSRVRPTDSPLIDIVHPWGFVNRSRREAMATRIGEILAKNPSEKQMLVVVGKTHLVGLSRLLEKAGFEPRRVEE